MKSETDPSLSKWYKENSCIYVSADHSCWNDEENAKRVRKSRFGRVQKSEVTGLGRMMKKYKGDSGEWLLSKVEKWEAARVDADETEDEEMVQTGSSLAVNGLGMSGMNGTGGVVASA